MSWALHAAAWIEGEAMWSGVEPPDDFAGLLAFWWAACVRYHADTVPAARAAEEIDKHLLWGTEMRPDVERWGEGPQGIGTGPAARRMRLA